MTQGTNLAKTIIPKATKRQSAGGRKAVPATLYGGVAQLGEHLPCKQGVKGSIPFISTSDSVAPNHRIRKARNERSGPLAGKDWIRDVAKMNTNQWPPKNNGL